MAIYSNTVNVAASQWSADTLTIVDADGVMRIVNAEPYRRKVTVYTDPDSVGVLYLVPSNGQHKGGVRLVPGAGFDFDHAAEIYGYTIGGEVLVNIVSQSGAAC